MLRLCQLYAVLLVGGISTRTGAAPQMEATQNAMEQELGNILQSAMGSPGATPAEKKSETPEVTAPAGATTPDLEMSSLLGAMAQATSGSQAPQTEALLGKLLEAAAKKSAIPKPSADKPAPKKDIVMDEQAKQIAVLMKLDAEAHRLRQLKLKMEEEKKAKAAAEKKAAAEAAKKKKAKEAVINSTSNSTVSAQNVTLSNTTVEQTNSSTATANASVETTAPEPAKPQPVPVEEPKKVIPTFKTKKEEAKWKMNEARKILQQAKMATAQALEYARERKTKVNKHNKNDVDDIIKKAEIALVHVGDHIGMEYKHFKK